MHLIMLYDGKEGLCSNKKTAKCVNNASEVCTGMEVYKNRYMQYCNNQRLTLLILVYSRQQNLENKLKIASSCRISHFFCLCSCSHFSLSNFNHC